MNNPVVTAFLEENSKYLSPNSDSAIAISQIPDAAWSAILEALDDLSGGATEPGIDCAVAITRETLADFDHTRATHWSERGSRTECEFGGFKALKFEKFQPKRGEQRKDILVVDLGEIRVALY